LQSKEHVSMLSAIIIWYIQASSLISAHTSSE
jgi:hypothetical protein